MSNLPNELTDWNIQVNFGFIEETQIGDTVFVVFNGNSGTFKVNVKVVLNPTLMDGIRVVGNRERHVFQTKIDRMTVRICRYAVSNSYAKTWSNSYAKTCCSACGKDICESNVKIIFEGESDTRGVLPMHTKCLDEFYAFRKYVLNEHSRELLQYGIDI